MSLFIAKYRIPWIFKWNYVIDSKEVHRQHFTKWWDKFKIDRIIDLVLSDFKNTSIPAVAVQTALPAAQSAATQALPEFPEVHQSLLDISPSPSTKGKAKTPSSKKSSSSRKKEQSQLTGLAQQLIEQLRKAEEREANGSDSDSSDASSQPPPLWGDRDNEPDFFPPDAQDPNDF